MEQTKEYKYKVSVVTAVYNVEDYLSEMIDSIIAQNIGFENVQLILIDDGSQDSSGEICDQYAAQYPENIVVVHKENGGVSSARNEGLKYVEGAYVNFTDADDILENNALKSMYAYLKENEKEIDLVTIRIELLGGGIKDHPLNYKFEITKIVDLEKEYSFVQLAVHSTLIKQECFQNRSFDNSLAYLEDMQLVTDILLDKMRYGVVCGTNYIYRRRSNSAVSACRSRISYYCQPVERGLLLSLQKALKKKGYIPKFVQYACMYDLQWRFLQNPFVEHGVLSYVEEEKYKELILNVLQYIDNSIIVEQKNIGNNYKAAVLLLKKENLSRREIVLCSEDIKLRVRGSFTSVGLSNYTMTYEFFSVFPDRVEIEGFIRCFPKLDGMEVILKQPQDNNNLPIEYKAKKITTRNDKCTYCIDCIATEAKGFLFQIKRDEIPERIELQLCLRYRGVDVNCKNILMEKFFPLSVKMESSYYFQDGVLLTSSKGLLNITKTKDRTIVKKCEHNFVEEIKLDTDKAAEEAARLRNMYRILKRIKHKEIWLISDRKSKADDNGEAFFTYMNTIGRNRNIQTYFVLDKDSKDYERLCKIGKGVPFGSKKHKILALLSDKIISSQGEDFIFHYFGEKIHYYKDILNRQKFVYLQHGVIKDDLSRWLARPNKNISLFITVTNKEHESILEGAYYYDQTQVRCTGFPRYDYLYDNSQNNKIIVFMPTWRAYLAGKYDVNTDSRTLNKGFKQSTYCQMYQSVFQDIRLLEAAKKYQYQIGIVWHPMMPRECLQFICKDSNIMVFDRERRYKEVFAECSLIVTDYSSAVFDFAYLRKPVIYYQKDVDEFFSGKHMYDKGYFDYERDGFGEVEYTADTLIDRMIEYMKNGCQLKDYYRERIDRTFRYSDQNNCQRVYEEIKRL